MGVRRRVLALVAGVAVVVGSAVAFAPDGVAALACSSVTWAEGATYPAGTQVTYNGHLYQALVTHTASPSAGRNPAATPALWSHLDAHNDSGDLTTRTLTLPTTMRLLTVPSTWPAT